MPRPGAGAGQSHLIPALEVGGFVFGLNQSASRTNFLGHTRFGVVEWRPDEGVRRTVGE